MKRLLLALLLVAQSAHATVYFASGDDLCKAPADAGGTYGWTISGSPAITTSVEATAGNLCALRFTPTSGVAQYVGAPAWSSASSLRVSCRITPRSTGGGSCTREVVSLVGSGGDWSGKAAIASMRASGTQVILQAFYGDQAQTTCSGSPQLGKQCATVSDCPELRTGEAQCSASSLASSLLMDIGTTYEFTLTQDNGSGATAGTVTVGLYQGTAGANSAVDARGSRDRIVGECSGGTNDLARCNVDSECPSGTCAVTNVVAPTTFRRGSSDTTSCAPQFDLEGCWVYDGTVVKNWRMETLYTSSGVGTDTDWTVTGTNAGVALNDGTAPNTTTFVDKTNGTGTIPLAIDVPLANPATPIPTPIVAVAFEALVQDRENTSARTTTVRLDATDGTNRTNGTHATLIDWADEGASGAYYAITPEPYLLAPDGSAWSQAALDALQISVNRSASTHTTNAVRATSAVAYVISQTADPAPPTKIPDRDGDGEKTVCFVGDSTWDNLDFQNALVAGLVEPTNIYFFTRGGSHIGDAAAEWSLLAEGTPSTFLGLDVARGNPSGGRTCDVIFISHLVNYIYSNLALSDPRLPTSWKGAAQAGYCEMQGAAGQGDPCHCPIVHPRTSQEATPGPNVTPAAWRCINSGAFMTPATFFLGRFYCACTTDAGCTHGRRTPGPLHTPAVCNTANPLFKYCTDSHGSGVTNVDAPPSTRTSFAATGCTDSPGCVGGLCIQKHGTGQLASLVSDITTANAAIQAFPPIIVWVSAPHFLLLDNLNSSLAFDQAVPMFDHARTLYRRQTYFADLLAYFRQRFPEHSCASSPCSATDDSTLGLRDGVHWTVAGQFAAAQLLVDVLTIGQANGVCTSTTCTAGLVGDTCSANADCDTFRAGFTL